MMDLQVKNGTKVLVHSKTVGSSFKQVARRGSGYNPEELPFFGWIKGTKMGYSTIYIIAYAEGYGGGDYYQRSDFEIVSGDTFTDGDFEL